MTILHRTVFVLSEDTEGDVRQMSKMKAGIGSENGKGVRWVETRREEVGLG